MSARGAVALGAVALALAASPVARADGDPASDYLITQKVFYSFAAGIPNDRAQQLNGIVANANRAGFTIRVALIRTNSDLGSVYQLYRQPQKYAQFLGQELLFVYHSRLLIVMPNGFGYAVRGKPSPGEKRALAGLAAPGNDGARIAEAATLAVQRLARADGHDLAVPTGSDSSATSDRIKIGAIAVTGAVLIAAALLVRRTRRAAHR